MREEVVDKFEVTESCEDQSLNNEQKAIIACLNPAPLIIVDVTISNQKVQALIDSGARYSLMTSALSNQVEVELNKQDKVTIAGYGNGREVTEGSIIEKINLSGLNFKHKFHVLSDKSIKNDMILGLDFLLNHGVTLDLRNRKVKLRGKKNASIQIVMGNDSERNKIIRENTPVYAAKDVTIAKGSTVKIPIGNEPWLESEKDAIFFFEGNESCQSTEFYCGVLAAENMEILANNRGNEKRNIKKGDKIGIISTLVELDASEVKEKWNMKKAREEIRIENDQLSDSDRNKIYEMLMSVNGALSTGDTDIGKAKVVPHKIELTNYTPIWQKPRTFAEPINQEIENQCAELLNNDIIEFTDSQWSSPCVPIRKADGGLRLCIDYRKVNSVTKNEQFPMPNLNHCLYRAQNVKFFTKLDLVRGYYQVEIDEDSRPFTAFSTTRNHYQFKRLAFGLKNSGIAFQRNMQQILSPLSSSNIVVYIDDILIMSETFEEHLLLVRKVLHTLATYNIKIKVKKCEFFKKNVSFLGHLLSEDGIEKSPDFVDKVKTFHKPTTITELGKFLGLINFQRKFIPHCSTIMKPLTELTGKPKKSKIKWTEDRERAFERLKEEVEKEVKLSYPDYSENAEDLELHVDASNTGAGACLMQRINGICKVIGYMSTSFSQTQSRYSTIERELTAIRWGVQMFKPFIYGVKFVLFTDHKPLIYMQNMVPHSSRIQRTLEELSEYEFQIKYQPGAQNEAADYLSRFNVKSEESKIEIEGLPKELSVVEKVDGGGDSIFEALLIAMKYTIEDEDILPENHAQLREELVQELLLNLKKYNLDTNKQGKNKIKMMLNTGQLPCTEVLLAAANKYDVEIRVYHNMPRPVFYVGKGDRATKKIVNLQCISYVHYNPLFTKKQIQMDKNDNKSVNCCWSLIRTDENLDLESDEEDENISDIFRTDNSNLSCQRHANKSTCLGEISYRNNNLCALLDTGAQVSVIDEENWNRIKKGDELIDTSREWKLFGIAGGCTDIVGIVRLSVKVGDKYMPPFLLLLSDNLIYRAAFSLV